MNPYNENLLVEQSVIAIFEKLGYQSINCYTEKFGVEGTLGRNNSGEEVKTDYL